LERDRGVGGGDVVVVVEVAFRRRVAPRLYERISILTAAARDRVWGVADAVAV
jgi:hypothetical protein